MLWLGSVPVFSDCSCFSLQWELYELSVAVLKSIASCKKTTIHPNRQQCEYTQGYKIFSCCDTLSLLLSFSKKKVQINKKELYYVGVQSSLRTISCLSSGLMSDFIRPHRGQSSAGVPSWPSGPCGALEADFLSNWVALSGADFGLDALWETVWM